MKLKIKKDFLRRHDFLINEIKSLEYKAIVNNKIIPLKVRMSYISNPDRPKLPKFTRIKNLCILTGRTRGVLKRWGISRHTFRNLADNGLIPGIRKASW